MLFVALTEVFLTPTEVFFNLSLSLLSGTLISTDLTPRVATLLPVIASEVTSAPLCSCSGAVRAVSDSGHKKPRRPQRHIGTGAQERLAFRFGAALAPRCCPFPVSSTVAVVNAPLAQRNSHYTASARRSNRLQRGCQPAGVGRLNVRLACVERATTMRTGSLALVFISTCTMCGGTHTKSPACASCASSSCVAAEKARVARDDVDAALGFAVVVHRRDQPRPQLDVAQPDLLRRRPCSRRSPPRAASPRWPVGAAIGGLDHAQPAFVGLVVTG